MLVVVERREERSREGAVVGKGKSENKKIDDGQQTAAKVDG